MRMLALAQAWQERGGEPIFVVSTCPASLRSQLNGESIEVIQLNATNLGGLDDLTQTLAEAQRINPSWIVLDGYHFNYNYQKTVRTAGHSLMVMDDYCYSDRWSADLILNQNIGSEDNLYWNDAEGGETLIGHCYTMLRREFWDLDKRSECPRPLQNILVTLGGSDPNNATDKILDVVRNIENTLNLRVLLGVDNPCAEFIKSSCENYPHKVSFFENVQGMEPHYRWAHGVISGGGSTCYEWMLFGLPGAVVTIADNQLPIVRSLKATGRALDLGWWHAIDLKRTGELLADWVRNPSDPSRENLVDGNGGRRVTQFLSGAPFWMRRAQQCDVSLYFDLVNDPDVRNNSFNSEPVNWDSHVKWFSKKLFCEQSRIFAAFDLRGEFVGQVRFDLLADTEDEWEIGFAIARQFRGQRIGGTLVDAACRQLGATASLPPRVYASVKKENIPSARVFKKLNFELLQENVQAGAYRFTKEIGGS